MRTHSYFLKSGKGTYGLGHTQITPDDVYLNYKPQDNYLALELLNEIGRFSNRIQHLQETVFYNSVYITSDLLENFSNSAQFREFPIYYSRVAETGRLLVDQTRIAVDFTNTTVFIKNNSTTLTTGNRRFKIIGTAQPAYENYVWYTCEYVPFTPYAFDSLGSFMPNNTTWFLAYQHETIGTSVSPGNLIAIDEGNGTGYVIGGQDRSLNANIGNSSIDIGLVDATSQPTDLGYGAGAPASINIGHSNSITGGGYSGVFGSANEIRSSSFSNYLLGVFNKILSGYGNICIGLYNEAATNSNGFAVLLGMNNRAGSNFPAGALGMALDVRARNQVAVGVANTIWNGGDGDSNRPTFVVGIGTYTTPAGPFEAISRRDGFVVNYDGTAFLPESTIENINAAGDKHIVTKEWVLDTIGAEDANNFINTSADTLLAGNIITENEDLSLTLGEGRITASKGIGGIASFNAGETTNTEGEVQKLAIIGSLDVNDNSFSELQLSPKGIVNLYVDNLDTATENNTDIGVYNPDYATIALKGKPILSFADTWIRLNPTNAFTSGIYCGNTTLRTDGTLEIGANGSAFKVSPTGTVTAAGNITGNSDIRLKKEVQPLEERVLDKILKLSPSTYKWKDAKMEQTTQLGFIAQDVEAQFPEWVHKGEDNLSLSYDKMGAVLAVKGVQELHDEISKLKSELNEMKNLIKDLIQNK